MTGRAPSRCHTGIVVVDVAGASFGFPIAVVRDILGAYTAQRARGGSGAVAQLLDQSGQAIPLLHLRQCLGGPCSKATRKSRVVVVESGEHVVGVIVDAVIEIVEIPSTLVEAVAPAAVTHPAIRQVAWLGGQAVRLLDPEVLIQTAALDAAG